MTSIQIDNSFLLLFLFFILLSFLSSIKNKKDKNKKKELNKIIGLKTVKEEIKYYMEFINNSDKYIDWEVKIPKGILLAGPPGTGKTLLVKTLAEELDIPLISASGSEFIEKYVGVGAARVRKLFNKAKSKKKCIIFIDEIDAVGRKRDFDNNSERASTVNQLLTEMDGFTETTNIIVFAATNLVKILDPALTRSGRFDKKVFFDLPNNEERIEMYKLYLNDMILPDNLSYSVLSERTAGVSGADIANIANQSKINAIKKGNNVKTLSESNIQEAIDEILIGREKRERVLSKEERIRVAHHEAGHCFMGYVLENCNQPIKVSIIPRGEAALGFSQQKPSNKKLMTRDEVLSKISVLLGGRSAEKIFFGNVSTGASDDIEKISMLIKNFSDNWGMNKNIGPINLKMLDNLGTNITNKLTDTSKEIVDKIESQTIDILTNNKESVKKIAEKLLTEETITYKEIQQLLSEDLQDSEKINI
jgi:ATP-dependent metalloprotease FtsH